MDYILPQWDYYWETPFGETNPSFPNCNMDRPDNGNPNQLMMMINHFLNIEIPWVKIKIPDQIRAPRTNSFESINAQAELCKAQWGKTANVILVCLRKLKRRGYDTDVYSLTGLTWGMP